MLSVSVLVFLVVFDHDVLLVRRVTMAGCIIQLQGTETRNKKKTEEK